MWFLVCISGTALACYLDVTGRMKSPWFHYMLGFIVATATDLLMYK